MTTLGRTASLGDTLRNIRESKDMTLRAAATATGISNAYISQIETGRIVTPSPDFLRRFAHGYGVSYDALMRVAGYADATHDATPIVPPPILGRAASLRIAYAAAMQDVAMLRESVRVCVDVTKRMTARADAAEAEMARLRAFVAENGIQFGYLGGDGKLCLGCDGYCTGDHDAGCIVAEARAAQKEARE